MKLRALVMAITLLKSIGAYGQVNHKKAFQVALEHGRVGKEISFNQSKGKDRDSLVLVYLGEIKTTKGRYLKIVTSRWYWGLAPRATSRIIIFSQKNQYLGDYYITMTYDVPDKIEGTSLVFINEKGTDCTENLVTKVSFKKGIPKSFFLECKGHLGDIYSFATNLKTPFWQSF